MEGRFPPSSDGNVNLHLNPSFLHPEEGAETYVVQVPRDQVYRIPPPENAKIVEIYSKPDQKKNKCTCCCWFLLVIAIIGIGVGIFFGVSHLLFNPKSPKLHLTSIQAKNSHPQYEILMLAENPNERFDLLYKKDGKASLVYKEHKIADGGFPKTSQESKTSSKISFTLDGSKAILPKETRKSLNDTTPKSMTLKIDDSIELNSWFKKLSKGITITCDFKVNSLDTKSKISSENCKTNF